MPKLSWKVRAVPAKVPWTEAGMPMRFSAASMVATASDSDLPGGRLNERVVATKWP